MKLSFFLNPVIEITASLITLNMVNLRVLNNTISKKNKKYDDIITL